MIDHDKLREFETLLKIASDNLSEAITDYVPDEFFEAEDDGGGDDDEGTITATRIRDVHDVIERAFASFDWEVARALSELKKATRS
jgi:hypothetical protein